MQIEAVCLQYLASQVSDPTLRQQLTPTSQLGCKRVLPSDDYYPALCQSNVKLTSSAAVKVGLAGGKGWREVEDWVYCIRLK